MPPDISTHKVLRLNAKAEFDALPAEIFLNTIEQLQRSAIAPFSTSALLLLTELSKRLLADPAAKLYPQFTALGYWLRPSQLQRMKQAFEASALPGRTKTPRGVAFHLPPQNVDTLFVYSWATSVLAGNANVVRLPSQMSESTQVLCRIVVSALVAVGEWGRHFFCAYDHDSGLTSSLSAFSDLRLIWGGDRKVREISTHSLRPDGLSLSFPDRQSFAVIDTAHYQSLDASARDHLASRFYNDIYWFDQLGCGSPRVIFWVGKPLDLDNDLFGRIVEVAKGKSYPVQLGVALGKFAVMNDALASGTATGAKQFGAELDVLTARMMPGLATTFHGGGLLTSVVIEHLSDVAQIVDRKTQTITHAGFEENQLRDLSQVLVGRGGYRIVPVGEALNFEPVWDGIDLFDHMTRSIVFR